MVDYFRFIGPILGVMEPEAAHGLTLWALKKGLVPSPEPFEDPVLKVRLWGMDFANPVGLAAGFDKNGELAEALLGQGFGFIEVGSVTPRPQPGQSKPRLFRLFSDHALINRMGFNNDGQEVMAEHLGKRQRPGIVGVNLGRNQGSAAPIADFVAGARTLAGVADYLAVNVSSPNTPGLRALQGRDRLSGLLEAVLAARNAAPPPDRPPLLLKIAPDLTEADKKDIAEVAVAAGIDGLIATNTTIGRPTGMTSPSRTQAGGLSGRPLFEPSTGVLADMYRLTQGKLPLIGVGGIESARHAYAKIRAGASLVQLYTALIFHGPSLVNRIKRDLVQLIRADGFDNIAAAVGADHR